MQLAGVAVHHFAQICQSRWYFSGIVDLNKSPLDNAVPTIDLDVYNLGNCHTFLPFELPKLPHMCECWDPSHEMVKHNVVNDTSTIENDRSQEQIYP
jgi:hypothetical protein